MKKLSEKSRKILRMIYQGLGAATVSLLFQACYGMPLDYTGTADMYGMPPDWENDVTIHGVVRSKTEAPVPGIKVSIKDLASQDLTDSQGNFYVYGPRQESYKLKFEDVDAAENGSFKTLKKKIFLDETGMYLYIYLEEADYPEEDDGEEK
jgi:putative lipoprotein (rSAM/lipoprotein system)